MNTKKNPHTKHARVPSFLINRNFALLLMGRVVSGIGDSLFNTVLVLWIVTLIARGQAWAPLAVSGALVCSSLPTILVGPIAGVFVDRWENKRRILLCMEVLCALLMFFLLSLSFDLNSHLSVFWLLGTIYLIVFLSSICVQFAVPSFIALTADVVDKPRLLRASGLIETVGNVALFVGPPLGALLFFSVGLPWAILFNALSFIVSFLAALAIRVDPITGSERKGTWVPSSFWRDFGAGLRFSISNHVLVTVICSGVLLLLGAGALNTLDIFFVTENLHTHASLYGVLGGTLGVGLILGSLLASTGFLSRYVGIVRTFWLGLVLWGVLMLVYARMTNLVPALIVIVLLGLMTASFETAYVPLVLHVIPRNLTGRIFSILNTVFKGASLLSISIAGLLYGTILSFFHVNFLGIAFGPIDTIFTGTGLLAILGGLFAMINLRRVVFAIEGDEPARSEDSIPVI